MAAPAPGDPSDTPAARCDVVAATAPTTSDLTHPAADARHDDSYALFGTLRELRAFAQSLRATAADLDRRLAAIADPVSRVRELHATLEDDSRPLAYDRGRIEQASLAVSTLLQRSHKLQSDYGDVTARIQLNWERAATALEKLQDGSGERSARRLARLVESLEKVIYDCGMITIPGRVLDQLKTLPVGGALNFADSYADELSSAADRRRLIRYMSLYPGFLFGLIDVDSERIFRASSNPFRRAFSLVMMVFLALLGFGLIYGLCYVGDGRDWPFATGKLGEHFAAYALLLVGALVHVLVNLLKQDRAASQSNEVLADWIMRIHVKEVSYWLSVVSLWICFVGISFALKGPADWKTAFFIGYSYDSFIDLFLRRFDDAAAASKSTVEKTLAGAAPQAGSTS